MRTIIIVGVVAWLSGCGERSSPENVPAASPDARADSHDAQTPQKNPPPDIRTGKPTPASADTPTDGGGATAIAPAPSPSSSEEPRPAIDACYDDCLAQNQARAVAWEQVQEDCRASCDGTQIRLEALGGP